MIETILSAGITGLLGTVITKGVEIWQEKEKFKREQELAKIQLLLADKEIEKIKVQAHGEVVVKEIEIGGSNYNSSMENDRATYSTGNSSFLLVLVDAARGTIRPALTLAYAGLFIWLVTKLNLVNFDTLDSKEVMSSAIYLTISTSLWWFGVRPGQRK